ncbi:MAG: flavodoxin [Solobacterium sp.]|nr:flavodoxin [Solobacterium sp.]
MKRLSILLAACMLLGGCGSNSAPEPAAEPASAPAETAAAETDNAGSEASKPLVLYFSRKGEQYVVGVIEEGNTAVVAKMIAEETGADLMKVLPADDHYPMTYDELTEVAKQEQNDNARPEYAGELNIADYDVIFVGSPVWWGDWPMLMYTVFENNDFSGKKLIPFSTHEGSGLAGFDKKLAKACPDSTILEGLAVRGSDAQNNREQTKQAVTDWLGTLEY